MNAPISGRSADDFDLHSELLTGPLADLSLLDRSLALAEVAMVSYLPVDQAERAANQLGFDRTTFVERDGAQAYLFENDRDRVLACRGTEPNEWNDIRADANAFTDLAETVGRVHRGFKREVDDIWPHIEPYLTEHDERDLWFTGHSLGGAMAQLAAGRCDLAHIPATPRAVVTFGSPRIGNQRYVASNRVEHVRWVNNNDIVTTVPPMWLRYRHRGNRIYIASDGTIRDRVTKRDRVRDQWQGFWAALKRRKVDHFADHAIAAYVAHIAAADRID
jgi:triacylglycerol lipase